MDEDEQDPYDESAADALEAEEGSDDPTAQERLGGAGYGDVAEKDWEDDSTRDKKKVLHDLKRNGSVPSENANCVILDEETNSRYESDENALRRMADPVCQNPHDGRFARRPRE